MERLRIILEVAVEVGAVAGVRMMVRGSAVEVAGGVCWSLSSSAVSLGVVLGGVVVDRSEI